MFLRVGCFHFGQVIFLSRLHCSLLLGLLPVMLGKTLVLHGLLPAVLGLTPVSLGFMHCLVCFLPFFVCFLSCSVCFHSCLVCCLARLVCSRVPSFASYLAWFVVSWLAWFVFQHHSGDFPTMTRLLSCCYACCLDSCDSFFWPASSLSRFASPSFVASQCPGLVALFFALHCFDLHRVLFAFPCSLLLALSFSFSLSSSFSPLY